MIRIFYDVLEINIALFPIILLVVLISGMLRKRYGASWMKVLWILLAVRMMIPYNFSLPSTEVRFLNSPGFEQGQYAGLEERGELENFWGDTEIHTSTVKNVETVERKSAIGRVYYSKVLVEIWILGFIISLLYYVWGYVVFGVKCRRSISIIADKQLEKELAGVQKKVLGKVCIPMYESAHVFSPMLIGVLRPKLVIPTFVEKWTSEELKFIMKHELCHYRKKDIILKFFMIVACCVNWFNPMLHMMKKQFFYDIELACDGNVLMDCNVDEREFYAQMMLSFARKQKGMHLFSTALNGDKFRMKNRIDYMFDMKVKKRGIGCIVLMGIMVTAFGTFVSCGYKPEEIYTTLMSTSGLLVSSLEWEKPQENTEINIDDAEFLPVMDIENCKKMLNGNYVVYTYKDEIFRSIYLRKEDGAYEFLCDAAGSNSVLITETGIYYNADLAGAVYYVDYVAKEPKPIVDHSHQGGEVYLINYDANYVYYTAFSALESETPGDYLLRVPREGGKWEIIYQFEENFNAAGLYMHCTVADGILYYYEDGSIKLYPEEE